VNSIGESGGVWNNISAQSNLASDGVHQFQLNTGGLTYQVQEINVTQIGFGHIVVGPGVVQDGAPAATPLPAALPLFAGGAALLGYLGFRRKRKALAAT
jgi:hypothetical protein